MDERNTIHLSSFSQAGPSSLPVISSQQIHKLEVRTKLHPNHSPHESSQCQAFLTFVSLDVVGPSEVANMNEGVR